MDVYERFVSRRVDNAAHRPRERVAGEPVFWHATDH